MASLSNINGIFDVHSTGAILFSTSHGTSGQILKSNGNAAPTWVAASTVIGGPYLPLTGGTLTGNLAISASNSLTVNGQFNINGTGNWSFRTVSGGNLILKDESNNADRVDFHTDGQVEILAAGSRFYPSIIFNNDINTGIYHAASDTLGFSGGGNELMTLNYSNGIKLSQYGSGSYTGTTAYNLAVDSSGNIIETTIPPDPTGVYLPLAGGTMSGAIVMGSSPITDIGSISTNIYKNQAGSLLFQQGVTTGTTRSLNLRTISPTNDPSSVDQSDATGITWGQRTDSNPYYIIYPKKENYNSSGNYSKLTIAWHTGIRIGANDAYGGTRFYDDSPDISGAAVILNVGVGNTNVGVVNNLTVGGDILVDNEIWLSRSNNSRNLRMTGATRTDGGFAGFSSTGANLWQLYGSGNSYGFLNGEWAAWDLEKAKGSNLYMNNNITYYLNTTSNSNFAGNLTIGGTLNVSNQGRFKSWYTSGSGLALEVGISAANGYVLTYNRDTNAYASTFIESTGIQFATHSSGKFYFTGGNVGIGTTSPFSKLQVGNATFTGANGMHNDTRVGMSNHGVLTGLMLASTYNDAAHPEYGLVFVQGPSTSSYNVWSISPDGPAKGSSLIFNYQAQSTNIHSPSNAKVCFQGSTGRVGIGTTSPNDIFDVRSPSWATRIQSTVDGTYLRMSANQIASYNSANAGSPLYINNSSSGNIIIAGGGGYVGIGTTSPGHKLEVIGRTKITESGDALRINSSDANGSYATWQNNGTAIGYVGSGYHLWSSPNNIATSLGIRAQTRLDLGIQASVHMTILSSGNVGIQNTSPGALLDVGATIHPNTTGIDVTGVNCIGLNTADNHNWLPYTDGNNYYSADNHTFRGGTNNGPNYMVINSSGNVGIGNTAPQTTLHTGPTTTITNVFTARFAASNFFASGGNSMFYVPDTAANIMMFGSNQFGTNQIEFYHKNPGTSQAYVGRISTSGSATSYVTSSDYRLKENIIPLSDSISRINQLKPSRFNFIEEPGKVVDGFIAHEVQDIVPEAIVGEKDEVDEEGGIIPQGIDQAKLVPLLVAAVQELEARVKELENK
jgi:hypothetical protein